MKGRHRDGAPALPVRTELAIAAIRVAMVAVLGITAAFTAYAFLNATVAVAALGVTALAAQLAFRHALATWSKS